MNVKYCSLSTLNDVRKNYHNIARNMMQMLKLLVKSSNFDKNRIQNIIEQLKQMKEKIVTCDDSIHVLLEEDDLIQDISESKALFVDIDKSVIQSEFVVNIYPERKFSGNPSEWLRFWESFQNEIHVREDLSSQFKLICLKHLLGGRPLDLVTKLGTSDSAYAKALERLQDEFSNKNMLLESHLGALFDLRPPVSTPISLMKFSSDFEYHMRALETYETDIEEVKCFGLSILNKKLPNRIWESINKDKKDDCTLTEFQNALNSEIGSMRLKFAEKSNSRSSVENMISAVRNNNEVFIQKFCHLCLQSHDFDKCLIYKTPSEKMRRAKELGLCLICFAIDHMTDNCEKPGCKLCKEQHNSVMCVSQEIIICQLCEGSHQVADCTIFSSKVMKMERALKLNLCLICFGNGHLSRKCVKFFECRICGADHSSLLCVQEVANEEKMKESEKTSLEFADKSDASSSEDDMNSANRNNNDVTSSVKFCPLCLQRHDIDNCSIYKTPSEKTKRAKELRLCLVCFAIDHTSDNCEKMPGCIFCEEQHNSILCVTQRRITCQLCGGGHPVADCTIFSSETTKRQRAMKLKLCLMCFDDDHPSGKCVKFSECEVYGAKHNSLLCARAKGNIKKINRNMAKGILVFFEKSNESCSNENTNEQTSSPKFCRLCFQSHDIDDCSIYKTPSEKMKRAKQLRLCLVCFAIDHITDNCESPGCIFCKKQHNSLICAPQEIIICQLCKGSHRLADCNIFSSKAMKLKRALRLKLCLKCFDNDHPSEKCVKFSGCEVCGANHNSLLCVRAKGIKKKRNRYIYMAKEILEFGEKSNESCSNENINEQTSSPKFCHLCLQSHDIYNCSIYKTPSEKMRRAKELRLCLICFAIDHMADNCESPCCKFCKEKHNSMMCVTQEIICQRCRGGHLDADCGIFYSKKRKRNNEKICQLCSLPHDIQACTVYTSKKKKRNRARKLRLCLLCFKNNHRTVKCFKYKKLCTVCLERHTPLCRRRVTRIKRNNRKKKIISIRRKYSANGRIFYNDN